MTTDHERALARLDEARFELKQARKRGDADEIGKARDKFEVEALTAGLIPAPDTGFEKPLDLDDDITSFILARGR